MENQKKNNRDNSFEWEQFAKLGEMMGDGLHHEPNGKWIIREYKRLMHILVPEVKEVEAKRRKLKNQQLDENMKNLLSEKRCIQDGCGGNLKQSRLGSKIAYCQTCNCRYKAIKSK